MTSQALPIRPGTPNDWDAVGALLRRAFHDRPDTETHEIDRRLFEPDRALIVTDGDRVVGHACAATRQMTVPGAVVPAAHVTMVAVAATHRRQGLLTRLMHRQLREVRDNGREPFAALWASEGRIYPRFGYGLASRRYSLGVDTREVALRRDWQSSPPTVARARSGTPAKLGDDLRAVYEKLRPDRPGWSTRNPHWWRYLLADHERIRDGCTEREAVVVDGPEGPDGYATWRVRGASGEAGPCGEVLVDSVVAETPATYTALWEFLLAIDLTRTVRYEYAAVDEPLLDLVAEPKRLAARLADGLWVRVVDVAAALAARRYAAPVDIVIEVTDPLLPENAGRWRLVGDSDGATCGPSDASPELACDIRDLSSAYLGGTSLATLARAGRVRELTPGALAPASIAFGWHRSPSTIDQF